MMRLHFVVEGQTEETFVNRVIVNHLGDFFVVGDVHSVTTSRKQGKIFRGGFPLGKGYDLLKTDLTLWMKQDQKSDAVFTTMFDLYALPDDFPGFQDAMACTDPYKRVGVLEAAMQKDITDRRFIPYIQLHEFEALLLADPRKLECQYIDQSSAIDKLIKDVGSCPPELIDDGPTTAPSKRIIQYLPEYSKQKTSTGSLVAEKIGLGTLRKKCPHFNDWLCRLEQLK